jgi:hypothetical protein
MNGGFHFDWFPFYHSAWRTDMNVRAMTPATRMYYLELLGVQFEEGFIPDDPITCARIIGESVAEVEAAWPVLRARFEQDPETPTHLRNHKMQSVRDEATRINAANRERAAHGGRALAKRNKESLQVRLEHASSTLGACTNTNTNTNELDTLRVSPSQAPGIDQKLLDSTLERESRGSDDGGGAAPPRTTSLKPRAPKLPLLAQEHAAARAITDAAWPLVKEQHPEIPITEVGWRARNKHAALQLAASGKTPRDVCAALRCAYTNPVACERGMNMISYLGPLLEKWLILRGIAQGTVKPFGAQQSAGERQSQERHAARINLIDFSLRPAE